MRRLTLAAVGSAVLAVLLYSGYWFYFAHRLRDQIGPWADARRAEGYDLRWQAATVGGFPFAFRLHFAQAALQVARPLPYALTSAEIAAAAAPWTPWRWSWTAPQGAVLDAAGGVSLTAARLAGSFTTSGSDGNLITIEAHDLAAGGSAQGFAAQTAGLKLTLPARPPASHLDPALSIAIDLGAVSLPVAVPSLGATIDAVAVAAVLKGRLPAGPAATALAAWRDDGGTLDITGAHVAWGTVDAALSGTLALDAALQPIGALSATIEQPDKAVDAAVASGSLKARFAGLAKTLLGALAKPGADGKPAVTVPVTLQNQQLFLGPAPVAVLPHIVWQ